MNPRLMCQFAYSVGVMAFALLGCSSDAPDNPVEPEIIYTESIPVADPGSSLQTDWWRQATFYECHVRSFKDSNGDGHGDFRGLISKLDYIQSLGVTAIWLMPITNSGYKYNGYDVADYRTVETDYGTLDDFDLLVSEVHKRNMALVIDFVANHTHIGHPFFVNALRGGGYRNWYVWNDTDPGWPHPWGIDQPVWHRGGGRWYYSRFSKDLPELNYHNPSVVAYMRDTARFWLNRGVDGFRVDVAHSLYENGPDAQEDQSETHQFFRDLRVVLDQYQNRFMISETPYRDTQYLGSGTDEFHSSFAFEYNGAMMAAVKSEDANALRQTVCYADLSPEGSALAILQSNHDPFAGDKPRSEFDGSIPKCKLSAAILFASPGIPFIYYGEEIGMKRYDYSDWDLWEDERGRTPMQWSAGAFAGFSTATPYILISKDYPQFNVEIEEGDAASLLTHYRKLGAARLSNEALRQGRGLVVYTSDLDTTAAWVRYTDTERVLVVANLTGIVRNVTVDLSWSPFNVTSNSMTAGTELFAGLAGFGTLTADNCNAYPVTVPAYSVLAIPFND